MSKFVGEKYRLRAGAPMPISGGGCGFVLHTFMGATNVVTIDTCTDSLPESSDFQGQGGDLLGATFSQLPVKGGGKFSGSTTAKDEYVEER